MPTMDKTWQASIGGQVARQRRRIVLSPRYSRFVSVMKLVLPLIAVALAALVVVWPLFGQRDEGFRLSFARVGVDTNDDFFMTNARYFGVDRNDQPYTVTAETAVQDTDDADRVHFTVPKADILMNGAKWLALLADRGSLVRSTNRLSLEGTVALYSDQGYEFHTERAVIDLDARIAEGNRPVEGQGPLGLLTANGFRIEGPDRTLRFTNGVRMTIFPGASGPRP